MGIYATAAELDDYTDVALPAAPADVEKLIARAERDIDSLLGPWLPQPATGLKLDPTLLLDWEAEALSRAVCAQAEYRQTVGEAVLSGELPAAPLRRIKGPDFEKEYATSVAAPKAPARYGPKVRQELLLISHLRSSGARAHA